MPHVSLADFLRDFRRHGRQTALVHRRGYRTERWSYRRLAETAAQFARELEARGVARGQRVLLWGENSAEWVAAFFGCLARGAVAVPIDRIAAPDFAARVARQVDAQLVVASRPLPQLNSPLPTLHFESLAAAVAHHSPAPYASSAARDASPERSRGNVAEILFTSGTTAEPRGVVLTHGNLLANLEPIEAEIARRRFYLRLERFVHPIRFLSLVPLSHVFGQVMGLFIPPLIAGAVVFQDSLNPADVLAACRRQRVSVLVAVPRLLESLREKLERDLDAEGRLDGFRRALAAAAGEKFWRRWWRFRSVRGRLGWKFIAIVSGGAALDAETERFWRRLGVVVIQGYGLTETAALISVNHPLFIAGGSVGRVLPGREAKLADDGEILIRGENVAAGYWEKDRLVPVPGADGWFRTGDLGALDAQGNLFFKGRKKSVIVTPEGMNIYPEDLEAALRRQPDVRDAVVVPVERGGNSEPCAVLLLRPGADAGDAVRRANLELAGFQRLRRWLVWPDDDFPRTPTHKPRLAEILSAVEQQLAAPATALAGSSALGELIARITGRAPAALRADANLEADLNLSSLERVELLSALEDRFQVELDESRFTAATTVAELEAMLQTPTAPEPEAVYPRWPQLAPVRWLRFILYYLLVWPATHLLAHPRVRGREHLSAVADGPVLIVSNHVTSLDAGFLLAALPPRLRHRLAVAMGAERLWAMRQPWFDFRSPHRARVEVPRERGFVHGLLDRAGYLLAVALFNVFPLPMHSGFRRSFTFAGELADRGASILVFPEGELTPDGRLQPFRGGIGLLAANLRLPVVPARIDGLFELKKAGKRFAAPGAISVTFGAPVRFDPAADPAAIARELQQRISALLL